MKLTVETKRHKQVFLLSFAEFKSGEWCKNITMGEDELLDVTYNGAKHILTVSRAQIRGTGKHTEKGDQDDNREGNDEE